MERAPSWEVGSQPGGEKVRKRGFMEDVSPPSYDCEARERKVTAAKARPEGRGTEAERPSRANSGPSLALRWFAGADPGPRGGSGGVRRRLGHPHAPPSCERKGTDESTRTSPPKEVQRQTAIQRDA